MQITAEEQSHWSFQPIQRPTVPRPNSPPLRDSIRTPIDAFLAQSLQTRELTFSPDAPKATQVRRLYLDLWGHPPTRSEIEAFESDSSPEAYEHLVDRLLASPRYGERWARHWLDIAGYADSDGYTNDDFPRPHAYKYRDYVIRALNEDKPLDRFLHEQIAGDELALLRHPTPQQAALDPETREWLVATGFLRMAADGTASGGVDATAARNQVMADTLKIVSSSLLGLTVGCAQCHDHRYDPIPQADYYRLRAIFEPAYDWKNWRSPNERRVSLYTDADRAQAAAIEAEAGKLGAEKEKKQQEYLDDALRKHLEKLDVPLREPLWAAFKTAPEKRTEEQKRLLRENPSANIHPGVLYQYNPKAAEDLKSMDARIAEIRARKPAEDFISPLTEPAGPPPETRRFHRGDPVQPKELIAPGTLSVLPHPGTSPDLAKATDPVPTSGRRLAFARWLTGPHNPLLPRVLVNRVWLHHFGRGLVGTPADFGLQGETPSHPELLDWLAATFTAPHAPDQPGHVSGLGWSLKRLHRLIVTSTAYRQSSENNPALADKDPDNRWYWKRPVQRLDAESLRDSLLATSGVLADRMYGTPVPVREDVVGQIVVGVDRKQGDNKMPVDVPLGEEEFRRSIYVEVRRSRPLAFLNTFDAPVMEVNCERRQSSTVAPQSLMLMNSEFILQQARLFSQRVRREAGAAPDQRITAAWRIAYGRNPGEPELVQARDFLARQVATLTRPGSPGPSPGSSPAPEDRALTNLCQALLASNEFLYLD
jgi:hypothetical protein